VIGGGSSIKRRTGRRPNLTEWPRLSVWSSHGESPPPWRGLGEHIRSGRLRSCRCGLIPDVCRAIASRNHNRCLRGAGEGTLAARLRLGQRLQGAAGLTGTEHGFGSKRRREGRRGEIYKKKPSRERTTVSSCYGNRMQDTTPFMGTRRVNGVQEWRVARVLMS